jgi:hypothetical protein
MKVEIRDKCVSIEGDDFAVEVWITGAVRLSYANERHDECLLSEWIPETRKACGHGEHDPLLTAEEIQKFWDQAFDASWTRAEVKALLRKEYGVERPMELRRSQARRVMDMILQIAQERDKLLGRPFCLSEFPDQPATLPDGPTHLADPKRNDYGNFLRNPRQTAWDGREPMTLCGRWQRFVAMAAAGKDPTCEDCRKRRKP